MINIGIDFDGTITDYYQFQSELMLKKYNMTVKDVTSIIFQKRYGISKESLGYKESDYYKEYFNTVKLKKMQIM